ncbi:YozD family protein [Niallia taxi]|uniref:YozD family protein n=1 Tax=Niallia taxi TaxID=2499688 RepID=UPI003F5F8BAB
MDEKEVVIDTEEIEQFFFRELIKRGFVPRTEEVEEIVDIVFDYLISVDVMEDVTDSEK